MYTARLETACVSVSVATTRYWPWEEREVGPQMNKFEQVSSDHHWMMSLAGEGGSGGGKEEREGRGSRRKGKGEGVGGGEGEGEDRRGGVGPQF